MVTVTIGMPVYNGASTLDKALATLCAQTFTDLQIIVSDNASTDATPDIIAKWAAKDKRVKYHRQPQNIGAVANFEWVLDNADSPWFAFAAHDDLWSPDYIKLLYSAVTAKPGLLLAAPCMVTMFEDGSIDKTFHFVDETRTAKTRLSRILASLRSAHSGWYYGLFSRAALISALKQTQDFKHVWGGDNIIILSFIFTDSITGSDGAVYYKWQTPLSDERYRPKTAIDQYILYRDTLRVSFRMLNAAPINYIQKTSLVPMIFRYARRIQKPKRILKAFFRDLF